MPSPCDLVVDALTIADDARSALGQSVPADAGFVIGDDYQIAVMVHGVESLNIGDSFQEEAVSLAREAMNIGDGYEDHLVGESLVTESIGISDGVRSGIYDKASEAANVSDSFRLGLAVKVSESLNIGDAVYQPQNPVSLASESLRIGDAVQSGFQSLVSESLNIGDAVNQRQSVVSLVTESLNIGDSAGVSAVRIDEVSDSLTIGDAVKISMTAVSLVSEDLVIEDRAISSGGGGAAWTSHVEPWAMTRYDNFEFNSFAEIGGKLFAAGPLGIYLISGDTDAGDQIAARVKHDLMDQVVNDRGEMAPDEHRKRPRYLYMSYRSNGQLGVEIGYVSNGTEATASYTLPARTATQYVNGRAEIGRGIFSRYLRPTLFNVSGANFSVNDSRLSVDSVKRKI